MWKKGSSATSASSGPSAAIPWFCSMFATRLRWVSITPFIAPVVPLEYGSAARSSGETSTASGVAPSSPRSIASSSDITSSVPESFAAGVRGSTSGPMAISSFAFESVSCLATSSGVSSGLIGVTTPPALRIAW